MSFVKLAKHSPALFRININKSLSQAFLLTFPSSTFLRAACAAPSMERAYGLTLQPQTPFWWLQVGLVHLRVSALAPKHLVAAADVSCCIAVRY